ncbi:MAG: 30S ribosomal protein S6 [Treponema sp.]
MRKYELMTVFPVEDAVFQAGIEELRSILKSFDVNVTSEQAFGDRDLCYEIRKNKKGRYTLFNIEAAPSCMIELNKRFKLVTQILTYLFVRLDE